MRAQLMNQAGVVLGELMLAQGFSMADVGRQLISGRPMVLVPMAEAPPAPADTDDKPKGKAK